MSSSGPLLQPMLLVSVVIGMALLTLFISLTVAGNSENTEAHSDSKEPRDPQMLRMSSNDSLSWLESLGLSEYFIVYHPRPHPFTHMHIHISSPPLSSKVCTHLHTHTHTHTHTRTGTHTHTHTRKHTHTGTHARAHARTYEHSIYENTLFSNDIFSLRARLYGIYIFLNASDDKKRTTDTVCCHVSFFIENVCFYFSCFVSDHNLQKWLLILVVL